MNILHTESSLNWGGQELRTLVEIGWLNANGHRAWLACDPHSELFLRGKKSGAPVLAVPMQRSFSLAANRQLRTILREQKIDLIHTHSPRDSWLALPFHLAGKTVVRSRHITLPVKPGFQRSFIYRHGCRRIIATAGIIRDALIRENKVAPEKIDIVGEFVQLDEFHPNLDGKPFREEFGIGTDAPLTGIIGMIRGEKGHAIFIDAALEVLKTHPRARFVLVGEGTGARKGERRCREKLIAAFGEANLDRAPILMTGYRSDIAQAIAALDIVAIPSLAEAQSRIAPEAFAMRRAVVASNVGGLPELVRDGETGLLVPPKNSSQLAAAIARLIDDVELRNRLAQNAYEFAVSELSLDQKMRQTLAIYEKAMGGKVR